MGNHRSLKQSWHYFEEICPPNGGRPGETEIRQRFYGTPVNIAIIRTDLVNELNQVIGSRSLPVTYYHFGNHGGPGQYWGKSVIGAEIGL